MWWRIFVWRVIFQLSFSCSIYRLSQNVRLRTFIQGLVIWHEALWLGVGLCIQYTSGNISSESAKGIGKRTPLSPWHELGNPPKLSPCLHPTVKTPHHISSCLKLSAMIKVQGTVPYVPYICDEIRTLTLACKPNLRRWLSPSMERWSRPGFIGGINEVVNSKKAA
jgi:hypothetical protein